MSESTEKVFAKGIFFVAPSEKAPEFIKGKVQIRVDDFVQFLNHYKNDFGFVNLNMKLSKDGKTTYFDLDTWQPKQPEEKKNDTSEIDKVLEKPDPIEYPEEEINLEDIPF